MHLHFEVVYYCRCWFLPTLTTTEAERSEALAVSVTPRILEVLGVEFYFSEWRFPFIWLIALRHGTNMRHQKVVSFNRSLDGGWRVTQTPPG